MPCARLKMVPTVLRCVLRYVLAQPPSDPGNAFVNPLAPPGTHSRGGEARKPAYRVWLAWLDTKADGGHGELWASSRGQFDVSLERKYGVDPGEPGRPCYG